MQQARADAAEQGKSTCCGRRRNGRRCGPRRLPREAEAESHASGEQAETAFVDETAEFIVERVVKH